MDEAVPQISGVLQLAISVRDLDRAVAFYRDTLGLRFLMGAPNMAFFDCGGVRLYLDANQTSQQTPANQFIYFRSTDILNHTLAFKNKNVSIQREPQLIARMPHSDLWLMWIHDTEGNLLGIMEERKPSAPSAN